jgi:hypothetical protein
MVWCENHEELGDFAGTLVFFFAIKNLMNFLLPSLACIFKVMYQKFAVIWRLVFIIFEPIRNILFLLVSLNLSN